MDAPCHNSSAAQLLFTLSPTLFDVRPLQTCERQRVCRSRQRVCRSCQRLRWDASRSALTGHTVYQSAKCSLPAMTTSSPSHLSGVLCHPTPGLRQVSNHTSGPIKYIFHAQEILIVFCLHTNKKQSILIFC